MSYVLRAITFDDVGNKRESSGHLRALYTLRETLD
jgi:hypothetical protein